MASTQEFIDYVCDQVADAGQVRMRRMFGEAFVYVDDRPSILICDDIPYVKKIDELAPLMTEAGATTGIPYEGAREHWVLDIDDRDFALSVLKILVPLTPIPVKRPRRSGGRTKPSAASS